MGIKDTEVMVACLHSLGLGIIAHSTGLMVISEEGVIFIGLHQEEGKGEQLAGQVEGAGLEEVGNLVEGEDRAAAVDPAAVDLAAVDPAPVDPVEAEEDNRIKFLPY